MTASAPCWRAWATMRRKASSRACSQTCSYSSILPPKIDFRPPVMPLTTLVARTTRPRTTPLCSAMVRPWTSLAVVTMTPGAFIVELIVSPWVVLRQPFVHARAHLRRQSEPELIERGAADAEGELRRRRDRQVAGPCAAQDLVHVAR